MRFNGSIPYYPSCNADIAQLVEQGFRKAQVAGSIPVISFLIRNSFHAIPLPLRARCQSVSSSDSRVPETVKVGREVGGASPVVEYEVMAPSSNGLGYDSLKVKIRVRVS